MIHATEQPLTKAVCAWHPRYFGEEKTLREAAPGHENDRVSCGICAKCAEIFMWPTPQNRNRRNP